jgi:membrane protein DedA with SNARE-associated domain
LPDIAQLIERAIAWVEPFYQSYGYLVVLLGALLEHTFFLAWAMPGGILVALGGLYAQSGALALPLVILVGAAGFAAGDHLDFVVGRSSRSILERVTKGRTMSLDYITSVRALPALALAYTNAVPRAAVFMGGAAAGLSYPRFLSLSIPLALLWSTVFSLLGYWLSSNRERLAGLLQAIGVGGQLILVTVLVVGGLYIYFQRRRGRSRVAPRSESGPGASA